MKQSLLQRVRSVGLPIGALVRRELITALRQKRTFAFAGLMIGLMVWLILDTWPGQWVSWGERGRWSREFLMMNSILLLFVGGLIVPAFAGTAISTEREKRTLDLLWGTGIGATSFVFGKFCASMAYYVLMLFAALPCIAVLYFLVGVDLWVLAALTFLLLSCAASIAAAGLWSSTRSKSSLGSLVSAYAMMLVVQGLPWSFLLLALAVTEVLGPVSNATMMNFAIPIPLFAMFAAVNTGMSTQLFTDAALFQGFLALVLLAASVWSVRKRLYKDDAPLAVGSHKKARTKRRRKRATGGRLIGEGAVTFAHLELRHLLEVPRRMPIVWVVLACVMLGGSLLFLREMKHVQSIDFEVILIMAYVMLIAATSMLTPLFAAGYRIRERQIGNEDALRMTLLRPHQVFFGKLAGGFVVTLVLWSAVSGAAWFLFDGRAAFGWEREAHILGVGTVTVCMLTALAFAVLLGTYLKEITGVLTVSYIVLLGLFIGLPILFVDAFDNMGSARQYDLDWLVTVSPIFMYAANINAISDWQATGEVDPYVWGLWRWSLALNTVAALTLVLGAYSRFAKVWRRGEE